MDATDIIYFGTALAIIASACFGFSALVGKGPRGTVMLAATALLTWSLALPHIMFDSDVGGVTREVDLLSTVLLMASVVGAMFAVLDLLQTHIRAKQPIAEWLLKQPLLWGGIACGAFYLLISSGDSEGSFLHRYFASHPILEIATGLFFFASAALVMRFGFLVSQRKTMDHVVLDPIPVDGQPVEESGRLLAQLDELPQPVQNSYLVHRLREAIRFVRRKDSADGLDAYLRHLEELDLASMNAAYATIRIIIWAIPILGFLGTVVGITMAIANMSPESLEQSMPEVVAGLGVAFDTTALALALVMALMFGKSVVEKVEERLLAAVDTRVSEELVGRFETVDAGSDPNVATVRRMSEQVLAAVEEMASRQAKVWKTTIDQSHLHWAEITKDAGRTVREALTTTLKSNLDHHAEALNRGTQKHAECLGASATQLADTISHSAQKSAGQLRDGLEKVAELLVESLHQHGETMATSERELAQENRRHLAEVEAALGEAMVVAADRQEHLIKQSEHLLTEMQVALIEAAGATVEQQEQLVKQSDVLLRVVDATGQIRELEASLNENLAAIRRTANFDELVSQLVSAVEVLGGQLGHLQALNNTVTIEQGHNAPHAA